MMNNDILNEHEEVAEYQIHNQEDFQDSTTKKRKPITSESIIDINNVFRVIVSSDEHSMIVQKKKCYDDNTENWVDWGYYGHWDALLSSIHNAMVKERLSKKNGNLIDVLNIFKETKKEISNWFQCAKIK